MVRMPRLSRWRRSDLTSIIEIGTLPGPLGHRAAAFRFQPPLTGGPAGTGRPSPARNPERLGQLRLEPLEGECPVASLGSGVLGDRPDHRAGLADDPLLQTRRQRVGCPDVEDGLDPRRGHVGVLAARSRRPRSLQLDLGERDERTSVGSDSGGHSPTPQPDPDGDRGPGSDSPWPSAFFIRRQAT